AAAVFAGQPEAGNFADTGAVAAGIEKYAGRLPAILFTLALIDACIIGASAVSLSTAYAIGDVMSLRHSLHRKVNDAKGFYGVYFGLVLLSAILVLTPGTPLGLLTNAVQALAGVLLPSATVFLLLLCNDRDVLGPWVNSRGLNLFTGAIVAVLVMLSLILTVAVLYPDIGEKQIVAILVVGGVLAVVVAIGARLAEPVVVPTRASQNSVATTEQIARERNLWRMLPLGELSPMRLTMLSRIWLIVLRGYLIVAGGLVLVRIVQLATVGA
ncbi:MAG: divalent metal cation transporter, partial [Bradyrhizobium sp.]|nr:divalent metal cation transporter [Bradyrhizobium sp.]